MTGDPISGMLDLYCRELKLPGVRAGYPAIARDAVSQGQSYPAFLAACLAQEIASRREHRLTTRLAQARFPVTKTLQTFDFAALPQLSSTLIRSLAEGSFITQRENVILVTLCLIMHTMFAANVHSGFTVKVHRVTAE